MRGAALFGLPDCSELFNATKNLVKSQWSAATDQLLSSTRQLSQAFTETQRQVGRVIQQSTTELAEGIRQGIEDVGQNAREGLQEFSDIAERSMENASRTASETQSQGGNGQTEGRDVQFRQGQAEESARKGTSGHARKS
jgi:hypothetical protein